MTKFAAKSIVGIFFLYGLFQITLILGAPWGHLAWGGQHEVLPVNLRFGSFISILLYIIFSLTILDRTKIISVFKNKKFSYLGTWVLTGYLLVGVLMNAISPSLPERYVQTPIAAVLFGLLLFVARSKK